MGNIPSSSAEAPRRRTSRPPQKLSKPRTGNPATAGLLTTNGISVVRTSSMPASASRRTLPTGSTPPPPSPRNIDSHTPTMEALLASSKETLLERRLSRSLLQLDAQEDDSRPKRSQSAGIPEQQRRGWRISRANSVIGAPERNGTQTQLVTPALSRNASRTSVNYDLSSYEAKRLLNLVQETTFEEHSVGSESHFEVTVSRRQSYTRPAQPSPVNPTSSLPRTQSDVSLYTPMRRRSLMTPGIATRPAVREPEIVVKPRPRHSLPATPARRDSFESMERELIRIPFPIPRVQTPCEAEYKQTGAFKLGTLRITNGSPARTPASIDGRSVKGKPTSQQQSSYFDIKVQVGVEHYGSSNDPLRPSANTDASLLKVPTRGVHSGDLPDLLPELDLAISPIGTIEPVPQSPLEISSKHTAMEDQLFEEAPLEYSGEVLDVRVDDNAKSDHRPHLSPSIMPKKTTNIDRSDSGIVASPASDVLPHSLSKADSGYSSNVSLRSFTSHKHAPDLVSPRSEKFRHLEPAKRTTEPHKPLPELTIRVPSIGESRPPVPDKDPPFRQQHPITTSTVSPLEPKDTHSSRRGKSLSTPAAQELPLSPSSVSSTPSPLSISSAPRKQGKIKRLLGGTRAPLMVHATHPSEEVTEVPPVPIAVKEKLLEHTGLSPISPRENEASHANEDEQCELPEDLPGKDSIRIFSTRQRAEWASVAHKSNRTIQSLSSTISRAASSVLPKNPIRMPMYHRTKSSTRKSEPKQAHKAPIEHHKDAIETSERAVDLKPRTTQDEEEHHSHRGRSKSVSVSAKATSGTSGGNGLVQRETRTAEGESHASAFANIRSSSRTPVSKTLPPVSMRTRNMESLQVSQLLKARSTSPGLSHKASREEFKSYPPADHPTQLNGATLSHRASHESFYAYTPADIRGFLNNPSQTSVMQPSRTNSSGGGGQYRTPDWSVQLEHGLPPSRRPSFEQSQRTLMHHQNRSLNRLPSSHSQGSNAPALKHRSSYDGYSYLAQQGHGRDNGPYPAMPRAGVNRSGNLSDDRHYQPPPHVPREHLRQRSLDQQASSPPYRILHSYNSPAYRNVPIWSYSFHHF
ncbi:hypothetical protein F5Y16DRAFT_379614 [Xylariaceae sp. FL0255]|nr:hypothetical protein F5Y16DRAFT_379614 [Xylariaceae sp. FL0255]